MIKPIQRPTRTDIIPLLLKSLVFTNITLPDPLDPRLYPDRPEKLQLPVYVRMRIRILHIRPLATPLSWEGYHCSEAWQQGQTTHIWPRRMDRGDGAFFSSRNASSSRRLFLRRPSRPPLHRLVALNHLLDQLLGHGRLFKLEAQHRLQTGAIHAEVRILE